MAVEASRAGVDREDKFFTNPDLNRLTRWRRLLLSYVTEVPYDADLRIWLIALAECGDWDTGEIRCSHARDERQVRVQHPHQPAKASGRTET